jgi:hypothetical protein
LALWFLGEASVVAVAAAAAVVETITMFPGRVYQLGTTPAIPHGVRNTTITTITEAGGAKPAIAQPANFIIEPELGRIEVRSDAPAIDAEGVEVEVTYAVAAHAESLVISGSQSIYGALRFIAENQHGSNKDHYYPYVKLTPDGDFSLKGDDWQNMTFTGMVMKRDSRTRRSYISQR